MFPIIGFLLSPTALKLEFLILVAFTPSILYMRWIRNAERYNREPWRSIALVFLWGAITAIVISLFLEVFLMGLYGEYVVRMYEFLQDNETASALVLTCVIAPFVEEGAKALGVYLARHHMFELEDGLVYGAAAGLGFAATENLFYESSTLSRYGLMAYVLIVLVRSISSAFLHGSATAVSGYGISRKAIYGRSTLPFYLLAVVMHSAFNFVASFSIVFEGTPLPLLGLLLAIVFGISAIKFIRHKIEELDAIHRYMRYGG
jgi:RsiW-degrading membrane proteinase PrsW (M82 family)